MAARAEGYDAVVSTPVGRFGIRLAGDAVCAIDRVSGRTPLHAPRSGPAAKAANELRDYFHKRHPPRVALKLDGTDFQRRVWHAMCRIPWGGTVSYGELARRLGSGARAVANACRDNPVPLIVPCHRVVGSNGLGGYMGATTGSRIEIKKWLLDHERH